MTVLEPSLRVARAQDAPAITALVRSAYRGPESRAGWTTEADLLDDERIDVQQVTKKVLTHDAAVLLHEEGHGLLGCCELVHRGGGLVYFGMFAVRPTLQAAGMGRRILAAAEQYAADRWQAQKIEMTVIAQRQELIAWYERRGYELTGETRPFPFDELIGGGALRPDLHFVVLAKHRAGTA